MKRVYYLRFEEGFPSSEHDIQVEEVENLRSTIFKPEFNWFTSMDSALKARDKIIKALQKAKERK